MFFCLQIEIMNLYKIIDINQPNNLLNKLLIGIQKERKFILFNSNIKHYKHSEIEYLLAFGVIDEVNITDTDTNSIEILRKFYTKYRDWIFGHINYDFKNTLENLSTRNKDNIGFPVASFFIPKVVIKIKDSKIYIYTSETKPYECNAAADKFILNFQKENFDEIIGQSSINQMIKSRISKEEYFEKIKKIKHHIQFGDIYEMNFCMEFYLEDYSANPADIYKQLNSVSPSPFSAFYRDNNCFLMSASPERYFLKKGNKIISQPIKGTSPRFTNAIEDKESINKLKNSIKEKSENVMIVDLVRNDLSRTAIPGSVKVEELFGIYSFPQVHQMISTISSQLKPEFDVFDVIATTFPMGSMTGAPKISAMYIIDQQEAISRGLFSGTVGYITPEGDADFNVIIRSLFYNQQKKYLSFITGGAITILSDAESEYQECILKAKGIIESLSE